MRWIKVACRRWMVVACTLSLGLTLTSPKFDENRVPEARRDSSAFLYFFHDPQPNGMLPLWSKTMECSSIPNGAEMERRGDQMSAIPSGRQTKWKIIFVNTAPKLETVSSQECLYVTRFVPLDDNYLTFTVVVWHEEIKMLKHSRVHLDERPESRTFLISSWPVAARARPKRLRRSPLLSVVNTKSRQNGEAE